MNRSSFIIRSFLLALGIPLIAAADGMVLSTEPYWIYESDQAAYLEYDADGNREDLHIQPRLKGDAREFAWIVPTPHLPEVSESDLGLFRNLSELTRRRNVDRDWDHGFGCGDGRYIAYPGDSEVEVEIIQEDLIGIYQTMIVSALDSEILTDSLQSWGYLHESNVEEVGAMLEGYVADGWYFVAMKVDSSAFDEFDYYDSWNRSMQPMAFSFWADEPVYPLRISELSASSYTSIALYIKTDHRMEIEGCETRYANRLSGSEMDQIRGAYPSLAAHLQEGDFLTKLERSYYHYGQNYEDYYPRQADSDAEYYPIHYSGLPLSLVFLLTLSIALRIREKNEIV